MPNHRTTCQSTLFEQQGHSEQRQMRANSWMAHADLQIHAGVSLLMLLLLLLLLQLHDCCRARRAPLDPN